jgi:predicted dehydrogenase
MSGARVVEVSAMGSNISSRKTEFSGDDLTVALLRLDNGAIAKVAANFGCVEPHFHRLVVYGTAGTFENNRGDAILWESRDPTASPRIITTEYPGVDKGDLLPSFVDGIIGRGAPEVNEDAAFDALSVGFAIDEAKNTGRTVQVDYI